MQLIKKIDEKLDNFKNETVPIIKRAENRNLLNQYVNETKSRLENDKKFQNILQPQDKKLIENELKSTIDWLNKNSEEADSEQFQTKLNVLQEKNSTYNK